MLKIFLHFFNMEVMRSFEFAMLHVVSVFLTSSTGRLTGPLPGEEERRNHSTTHFTD